MDSPFPPLMGPDATHVGVPRRFSVSPDSTLEGRVGHEKGLPGLPPVTSNANGPPASAQAPTFANESQARRQRNTSREHVKHRREISIDSKGMHALNPYSLQVEDGWIGSEPTFKSTGTRDTELGAVPASPTSTAQRLSDVPPLPNAFGHVRGYSSKYGPPVSPTTSNYTPSHAPSESVYSAKFRLDDEFSVTNFARHIGLVDGSDDMSLDDLVDHATTGDNHDIEENFEAGSLAQRRTNYSESTGYISSTCSNSRSISTNATSYHPSGSQDGRPGDTVTKTLEVREDRSLNDKMDSPTDPFFGGLASAAAEASDRAFTGDEMHGNELFFHHELNTHPVHPSAAPSSSLPDVEKDPMPTSIERPLKVNGHGSAKHGNNTSSVSSLANDFSLEKGIRRMRGSACDSIATIPRNGELPSHRPAQDTAGACPDIPESEEPGHDVEAAHGREPKLPKSMAEHVHLNPLPSPVSPTSPTRQRKGSRPRCRGCNEPIVGKSVSSADGRLTGRWHRGCFKCAKCQEPFETGDFYVHEDRPYCAQHYHELNGSLCAACGTGIEGTYLETEGVHGRSPSSSTSSLSPGSGGKSQSISSTSTSSSNGDLSSKKKYHPSCFKCHTCRILLRGDYFQWNGLPYCEPHARVAAGLQDYPTAPPSPYGQPQNGAPRPGYPPPGFARPPGYPRPNTPNGPVPAKGPYCYPPAPPGYLLNKPNIFIFFASAIKFR
ncbi:hypothetical protein KEM55_005827 [Ascosphaera atra]|nr:hypothetical protein KEM55_005827 [Ascosphaera atra]